MAARRPFKFSVARSFGAVSLLWFFALTFALTWTSFIAAGLLFDGPATSMTVPRNLLFLLGTVAPSIVAVALTSASEGRNGVRVLLRRLVQWRVGGRWYLFAITFMAAIKLAAALLHRAVTGEWPRFGHEAWYVMLAATFVSTAVMGQAGEEIGWRGFALPRLGARLGLGRASILLGIIWAAWHLPLFFLPGTDKTGQSFTVYLLQVTALSVAIAWLYAHTQGSLLLAMLMHAAINNMKDIVPAAVEGAANPFDMRTSLVVWITVGLLWLCAGYFLVRMPRATAPP